MDKSVNAGFLPVTLSVIHSESRRLVKGSVSSYLWFILLVSMSAYSLFAERYTDIAIDCSVLALKYVNNLMADILVYTTSFAISSSSDILSGKVPQMVVPTSIGIVFFIIFPLMLGLTLISRFVVKRASVIITGEKEIARTYPGARFSIYLGKFSAVLLLTIPMIGFLYIITHWIFTSLFPSTADLSGLVLETALVTSLLFASIGMLVSALCKKESTASWIGAGIAALTALLATIWILIPFIEFLLNLVNKDTDFLLSLEKISRLSPVTLDMMSVYALSSSGDYLIIQVIASFTFLILGMVTFIRQDTEY